MHQQQTFSGTIKDVQAQLGQWKAEIGDHITIQSQLFATRDIMTLTVTYDVPPPAE